MFESIVAGCDGFERGRNAAALANVLAEATDARLLLVAAYALGPVPPPESYREQRRRIERAIRGVRDELAPRALTATVAALSPAHALRHVAEREHADLIVVGRRRRSRLQHALASDHALQVLHGAPCAVAVVPDDAAAPAALRRIAVGFDGSPEARAALALAAALARRTGARLQLLAAVPDRLPVWSTGFAFGYPAFSAPQVEEEKLLEPARRRAEEQLRWVARDLDGVHAGFRVVAGEPAEVLADATATADLVVVGSRRWGMVRRLVLGSTSEATARRCRGPLLVVPRAAEPAEPAPEIVRETTATT